MHTHFNFILATSSDTGIPFGGGPSDTDFDNLGDFDLNLVFDVTLPSKIVIYEYFKDNRGNKVTRKIENEHF